MEIQIWIEFHQQFIVAVTPKGRIPMKNSPRYARALRQEIDRLEEQHGWTPDQDDMNRLIGIENAE